MNNASGPHLSLVLVAEEGAAAALQLSLQGGGPAPSEQLAAVEITVAATPVALRHRLEAGGVDAIVAEPGTPDLPPLDVLRAAGEAPVVVAAARPGTDPDLAAARAWLEAGASDVVFSAHLSRLQLAVERAVLAARRASAAREQETALAALASFAAAVRGTTSRPDMLPVVVAQVKALLGVAGAALLRREGASLVVEAADNWLLPAGKHLDASQGLAGQALASGEPAWALLERGQPEWTEAARAAGLKAAAFTPLIAQGQSTGVLAAAALAAFSPAQVRLMRGLAEMVASALNRAALHDQTEQRLHRLAALHTVDQAITTSFDLRVTLGLVLDELLSQLGVDAAAVALINPTTQALDYPVSRGLNTGQLRQASALRSSLPAGRVAAQRASLLLRLADEPPGALPPFMAGFATYYGVPLVAKGQVHGVLEVLHRGLLMPDAEWVEFAASLATQAAIAIDNATLFADLQRTNLDLTLAYDATIEGWARVLEARGIESHGHTRRVAEQSVAMARAAGFSEAELVHVRRGALLHDIGMLSVPEHVLLQPGPLDEAGMAAVRRHPEYGVEILAPIAFLRPALDIPASHHERWDGTGYPRGLRGDAIPQAARLFAVVDVWDALRSDRPWRAAWPEERARAYLRDQSGHQFDPHAVAVFLEQSLMI